MAIFVSVIDTVYEMIISLLMRGLRAFIPMYEGNITLPHHEVHDDGEDVEISEEVHTFKTIQEILKSEVQDTSIGAKNMIMYAGGVSIPVYQNPTIEFDAQIATIPYGEMVMMLEPRGRFLKIVHGTTEGWVLKEDVVDRAIRVYPEFRIGEENSVDNPNTAHVRAIVGDVFGLGRSEFALQAGEYILYRLWKKGIRITWPAVRPRVPGLWHKILKGVSNVHMGVTPRVGAIMEYMITEDSGHLAYVEAVFPDDTITISEVNRTDGGIYNEQELRKEEWKELKPVFIRLA
jgi:hypothetical protein